MPDYEREYEREEYLTPRPKASIRKDPIEDSEEIYIEHRKSTDRRRSSTPYFAEERYERYETEPEPEPARSTSSRSTSHRGKAVEVRSKTVEKSKIKACGPLCKDHPSHPSNNPPPPSDTDASYDSSDYERQKRSARKKKLIAAGLATATTIAAVNGAINHTKAAKERRRALREGEICSSEYELLKMRARARDIFSLGVVAVGLNNVHNAWKKHHVQRQEHEGLAKRHEQKRRRRIEREYEGSDGDSEGEGRERFRREERVERKMVGDGGSAGRREIREVAHEEVYRERESWGGRDRSRDDRSRDDRERRDRSRDTRYER